MNITEEVSLSYVGDYELSYVDLQLIKGTVHMLHNKHYEAVTAILKAATIELSSLQWLTEMSSYEESARVLRSAVYES